MSGTCQMVGRRPLLRPSGAPSLCSLPIPLSGGARVRSRGTASGAAASAVGAGELLEHALAICGHNPGNVFAISTVSLWSG
jgi:hypothetical protein